MGQSGERFVGTPKDIQSVDQLEDHKSVLDPLVDIAGEKGGPIVGCVQTHPDQTANGGAGEMARPPQVEEDLLPGFALGCANAVRLDLC